MAHCGHRLYTSRPPCSGLTRRRILALSRSGRKGSKCEGTNVLLRTVRFFKTALFFKTDISIDLAYQRAHSEGRSCSFSRSDSAIALCIRNLSQRALRQRAQKILLENHKGDGKSTQH
ncbi:unnamed protein product [Chondrus crispus]|uniref:Uncharacterized protein n=1 Tax=Chondrus crispus TaxID=2769 RepID=R7QM07_CHOCR|nr:unnamed protein product [Chondrus crispus]CDF39517.1 unnamed protein product [Chondrus crispus]|eukprot:XP_005719428.1 unnamed protein product [Chondrus crispus]